LKVARRLNIKIRRRKHYYFSYQCWIIQGLHFDDKALCIINYWKKSILFKIMNVLRQTNHNVHELYRTYIGFSKLYFVMEKHIC